MVLKIGNTCLEFAYNSRLDTIQAAIANYKNKKKIKKYVTKKLNSERKVFR